jgi:type VI protein secretion system component Hcp
MPNAYYLKLGSATEQVPGGSRDKCHEGWIKLASFGMGDQSKSSGSSGGTGRATFPDIVVSKTTDRASSTIFMAANSGRGFKSATIEVADEKTGVPKLRLTLSSVILNSYTVNTNAAEGHGQSESFTLNYAGAEWNHNPVAEEKAEETLHTGFFSLKAARKQ